MDDEAEENDVFKAVIVDGKRKRKPKIRDY